MPTDKEDPGQAPAEPVKTDTAPAAHQPGARHAPAAPRRGPPPRWLNRLADLVILPVVNLVAAMLISGLVVLAVGADPWHALLVLIDGAFGYPAAIGFTFYYATTFVFTGLAVAIAFHAGLFNIGGEGQAMLGGIGITLALLSLGDSLAFLGPVLALPLALAGAVALGGLWGFIPGWLQARRGSHVVITTIMMNFIASAVLTYLLVDILIDPVGQSPQSRPIAPGLTLAYWHDILPAVGIAANWNAPVNLSALVALAAAAAVWVLLWRTRLGYAIRAVGLNPEAAVYAGIDPARAVIIAMTLSGALAGCMALNVVMGDQHRLLLNFTSGAGFVGIAVSLMGRNHPAGIVLAAILFGALWQGGSELAFEVPGLDRELVVVIQGLVILFCGALDTLFRRPLLAALTPLLSRRHGPGRTVKPVGEAG